MIVDKMYPWEVCSQLEHDAPKVNYMVNKYLKQSVKFFLSCNSFPSWVYYKYTTTDTLNTYIIYFFSKSKETAKNPESGYFAFLDLKEKTVMQTYTEEFTDGTRRVLQEYKPHYFERYRERVLKNDKLNLIETACRYFTKHNNNGILLNINENIQKNLKKYGEHAKEVHLFPDGIGLGETAHIYEGVLKGQPLPPDAKLMTWYYMSTFVSTEMLFENQMDELSQLVFNFIDDLKKDVHISTDSLDDIIMFNDMQNNLFHQRKK